jgi:hypothetical protein
MFYPTTTTTTTTTTTDHLSLSVTFFHIFSS